MKALWIAGSLITAGLIVGGCGSSDSHPTVKTFDVTVTNLTSAQPMSPLATVMHPDDYEVFGVGTAATEGVELLAEGGDNTKMLAEAEVAGEDIAVKSGSGLLLPGGSDSISLSGSASCLSLATMLVNTNDAFAGASCIDVGSIKQGQSLTVYLVAYDAGTEANSETAATIPGPAGGGEGFNADRDDRGFVAVHGGAVTSDDGLATSALLFEHRWDNPVAEVTILRVQ